MDVVPGRRAVDRLAVKEDAHRPGPARRTEDDEYAASVEGEIDPSAGSGGGSLVADAPGAVVGEVVRRRRRRVAVLMRSRCYRPVREALPRAPRC